MATAIYGPMSWSMRRNGQGHREYKVVHKVRAGAKDGPANVLRTAGLPQPGDLWHFDDDSDDAAGCTWEASVQPIQSRKDEPTNLWSVEQTFSTERMVCKAHQFENPLQEPYKISFSFTSYQEEGIEDRFGLPILSSSHERLRGPQNEWDATRPRVVIQKNVADPQLPLIAQMADTVNATALWGLPPRSIKFRPGAVEQRWFGACGVYFSRTLEFEIRYRRRQGVDFLDTYTGTGTGTGLDTPVFQGPYENFDRDVLDEGTKVLRGRWNLTTGHWQDVNVGGSPPDPDNPAHFVRYQDPHGNTARVILDGRGRPFDRLVGTGTGSGHHQPGLIHVEKYGQSEFRLLGIPENLLTGK